MKDPITVRLTVSRHRTEGKNKTIAESEYVLGMMPGDVELVDADLVPIMKEALEGYRERIDPL